MGDQFYNVLGVHVVVAGSRNKIAKCLWLLQVPPSCASAGNQQTWCVNETGLRKVFPGCVRRWSKEPLWNMSINYSPARRKLDICPGVEPMRCSKRESGEFSFQAGEATRWRGVRENAGVFPNRGVARGVKCTGFGVGWRGGLVAGARFRGGEGDVCAGRKHKLWRRGRAVESTASAPPL